MVYGASHKVEQLARANRRSGDKIGSLMIHESDNTDDRLAVWHMLAQAKSQQQKRAQRHRQQRTVAGQMDLLDASPLRPVQVEISFTQDSVA